MKAAKAAEQNGGKLTEEELEYLRDTFEMFDKDGSGTLDRAEISSLLTVLNDNIPPPTEEVEWVFQYYDQDGNGTFDQREFMQIVERWYAGTLNEKPVTLPPNTNTVDNRSSKTHTENSSSEGFKCCCTLM
eukprot:PhF_6_TR40008/c0_g1_i1/m.59377